ncbi:SRPBCC domain-containing protein [Sphingomonas sp.]|uniref:SRPBCC family protein n=1 Tax=Sphingomonas sp. TaxID=28214 RepID=UPI000DAF4DC5|nr:SRPBCC domain-containing protein [Sphingomonas sp.]PZU06399.1 MAG: hypothetical protein DI605_19070 [Sphingomonas sp.]
MSGDGSVRIERLIAAPPSAVFETLLNPDAMRHWLAPHHFRVLDLDMTAREGGTYRAVIGEEADNGIVTGCFEKLVPGRHVRISWCWPDIDTDDVSHVDMHLSVVSPGTLLALTHDNHRSEEQRQARSRAWASCIGKLSDWLARQ